MKKLFTILAICCIISTLKSQSQFQSIIINKPLKDFPDVYDLSTPLNAGVTIYYLEYVNGNDSLWRGANSYTIVSSHLKGTFTNWIIEKDIKVQRLNDSIKELLIYKDSVVRMITEIGNSDRYRILDLILEDGKWLHCGNNDGGWAIENWRNDFYSNAPKYLSKLRRSNEIKTVSTDTLAFVNYLKQYGTEPIEFLLETLSKYPLVIYGEIHRRKISWDLLSSLLQDPRFPEIVGTVFVELPDYQQDEFDRFYASEKLDTEIVLDIMRSMMFSGWIDRGEYDFFVNLWKLNQTLPIEKRIRVVPTDEQTPWKLLNTKEDFDKWEENASDRNTRMADVVENTMKTKTDKRNCLFVVGYGHARKSHIPGSYSSYDQEPALTAGAQLVQRLSNNNVFTILQHVPWMRNIGNALGLVRQGLFDYVFETNGNKPVAFPLVDSPFGAEPYDADFDDCFDFRSGNFEDNFDGYIFLQPLKDEEGDYILYEEIWSDTFIDELKRRITITGWGDLNRQFGIEGEVTKEKIIESYKEDEGKKRWGYLFE